MNDLLVWLTEAPTTLWGFMALFFISWFLIDLFKTCICALITIPNIRTENGAKQNSMTFNDTLSGTFINPPIEEFVFRFLPFLGTFLWFPKSVLAITVTLLVSSAVFGWAHGHFLHIFSHGIGMGLPLGLVFLKVCGSSAESPKNIFLAFLIITLIHAAINGKIYFRRALK